MALTQDNLRRMLSEEARASRRTALYAQIAELEGHAPLAEALTALAAEQQQFADGHLDYLRGEKDADVGQVVGDTKSNLQALLAYESELAQATYLEMAATARAEGYHDVAGWFEALAQTRTALVGRLKDV